MLKNPQAALAVIPRPVQVNPIADAPATVLNGAKVIAPSAYAAEAAHHRGARDRDARPRLRCHRRLSGAGQLGHPGLRPQGHDQLGRPPLYFRAKEETVQFIDDIFAELCPIFPGPCFHIGSDKAPKEGKDWGEFEGRLDLHLKRLDALQVNYRRADGTPAVTELMGRGE